MGGIHSSSLICWPLLIYIKRWKAMQRIYQDLDPEQPIVRHCAEEIQTHRQTFEKWGWGCEFKGFNKGVRILRKFRVWDQN